MEEIQQLPEPELKRKAENEHKDLENQTAENNSEPVVKHARYEENNPVANSEENSTTENKQKENEKEVTGTQVVDNSSKEENPPESKGAEPKNNTGSNGRTDSVVDPLGYTKAEEFTSEIFKIQIHNLPKFGFSDLKKRLVSIGLKPHKLKSPRQEVVYICFRNDTDRQEALQKINGHVWKGRTLEAKVAAPSVDPFLEKKRQQRIQNDNSSSSDSLVSGKEEPLTSEDAQKRLKDSVVPLWDVDYPKQLETKTEKIKSFLKQFTHHHFLREQFRRMESWNQDGMPCPLLPIIASPVTSEYRNKNEFTIGYSHDGKTIKVGFRYGLYKNGTTSVGDSTGLGVVKSTAVPVIQSFEKFVSQSRWPPYLQQTSTGHWHTLTVRSFDSGHVMAMVDFHPRKMDKKEIDEAIDTIREFYTSGEGKDVVIKSFYFRLYAKGPQGVPKLQKIFGEEYVYESLLGLTFRISPEAFFQVNTKATEKLYSLIGEWCQSSTSSTILDICCGTGTIGLSMAKNVKEVIGVEMCQSAVEDARANAALNDITNATYYSSKVEDVMGRILASVLDTSSPSSSPQPKPPSSSSSSLSSESESVTTTTAATTTAEETVTAEATATEVESSKPVATKTSTTTTTTTTATTTSSSSSSPERSDVIAVVDPPRAGLHKSVIKLLRRSEDIKRLVYVSCNPQSAVDNFVDLIRPSTGKLRGRPFSLIQAVPVDLFPGTRHCELVLLFTR